MRPLILVVNTHNEIVEFLKRRLHLEGYIVISADDGGTGASLVKEKEPDLIISGLRLLKRDGYQMLQEIRTFSWVPVIILSSKEEDVYKIKALELGADDYVTVPFNPDELVLRIDAILKRLSVKKFSSKPDKIYFKNRTIVNFSTKSIEVCGKLVKISNEAWAILLHLANLPGVSVSPEYLLKDINQDSDPGNNRIRGLIKILRHCLGDSVRHPMIIIKDKKGYQLAPSQRS